MDSRRLQFSDRDNLGDSSMNSYSLAARIWRNTQRWEDFQPVARLGVMDRNTTRTVLAGLFAAFVLALSARAAGAAPANDDAYYAFNAAGSPLPEHKIVSDN